MKEFKYCLNSSTIKLAGLRQKIEIASQAGYDGIELWHDDMDQYLREGGAIANVRKWLQDGGLSVPTTIYLKDWFETDGEIYQKAIEECRRRMYQSVEVGAEFVIAGPPMAHADHDLGAQHYRELLAIGREVGVKPAMEFLGFVDDINSIEKGWEIVEKSGDPEGTIVVDPFHIFRGGGDLESIRQLGGDRIAIFHFNDAPRAPERTEQHDKDRVYPGDGHLDLRSMVSILREIQYRGPISLELFNETLWQQDPLEVARIGLGKMRQVVEG